jgi:CubicO group peptidase (beta-lactamase class C family)
MNKIFTISVTLIMISGISLAQKTDDRQEVIEYNIPVIESDGWATASITEAEIDAEKIGLLLENIADSTYRNIHSILIVKDGKLVMDEYFRGYKFEYSAPRFRGALTDFNSTTIHNLASVTKSVTGLLVGLAFDQGVLKDVNDKMIDFFPQYELPEDGRRKRITLHHLLTMTSGMEWNEQDFFYSNVENDIIQLFIVQDPVKYILSKPVIYNPGTIWYYNGGGTNLLGKIIHVTSGVDVENYADQYLFSPLKIKDYEWVYIKPDLVYTSGNLKLRPRDMAKLGYLVLNDGIWKGERIISLEWIQQMIKKQVSFSETRGYAYQWWLRTYQLGSYSLDTYYASGWGGQSIMVFPAFHSVIVFTGGNYDRKDPIDEILYRYLLPALIPDFKENKTVNDEVLFDQISKESPLSGEITIVEPSNNLDPDLKTLSGHWYGRWDYASAGHLIVREIDKNKAKIVYKFLDWSEMHKEINLTPSGRIEFTDGSANWTFEMDKREDVLIGYYKDGPSNSRIVMTRKK